MNTEEITSKFSRPEWDDWYMGLIFMFNMRSPDPATKHASVIVDPNHRPIGWGYNGAPSNCVDEIVPWNKRPDKHLFTIHSEDNAFKNGARRSYEDCTIYVSGYPCHLCWLDIVQNKISRVVYGKQVSYFGTQTEYCPDGNDKKQVEMLLNAYKGKIEIVEYKGDPIEQMCNAMMYYLNRVDPRHKNECIRIGNWTLSINKEDEI